MARLNLTLPPDTMKALERHAKGRPTAQVARALIQQGLDREERSRHLRQLAKDYAAGRQDALELLADFEPLAAEAVGEERD